MGKKSIGSKAINRDQRFRLIKMKMEKALNKSETTEITNLVIKCQQCDFKARYKFIRCPTCNTLQNQA